MAKSTESFRTKEQVLIDLANALHFTADSLENNREGDLALEQWQRLFMEFLRPVIRAAACFIGPFGIWALLAFMNSGNSFGESMHNVFEIAFHPKQLFEDHGWFVSAVVIVGTLGGIGMGFYKASQISMALYFDLIERKVVVKEGRIEGREEQTFRSGGRDPLESYYFDLKTERFEVNCQAVQALDSGAAYHIYVLPRSRRLVAIEPKLNDGGIAVAS